MVEQIMMDNGHHDNTKTNGEIEQHEDNRAAVNGDDLAENLNKMVTLNNIIILTYFKPYCLSLI